MNNKISGATAAIIGGSAAGFYTASLLARYGLSVKLYECFETINPVRRSLIVTHYAQRLLGQLIQPSVVNTIHRFELFADGQTATVTLRKPDLVIERARLIAALASDAESHGVQIFTGHNFLGCTPNRSKLLFGLSHHGRFVEESADVLVGADGANSKVAETAGWPKHSTVPLLQTLVKLPKDMSPDTSRVWFIPEETPFFYWLIPHSSDTGVLGLIAENEIAGRYHLEQFVRKKRLEADGLQTANIPQYERWIPNCREMGDGAVYLVGDAAAHVKMSTVGGIATGFRGALAAVKAISKQGANRELRALRQELNRHRLIRKVFHRFGTEEYSRLLDLMTPTVRSSLGNLSRDQTSKLLCNVLTRQPRFLLLALRSLVK